MKTIPTFIGLDTVYPTANGSSKRRLHFDGAASPLAASVSLDAIQTLLPHYSNTHSTVHHSAQFSTQALAWAREQILKFLNADSDIYTAIFTGSGSTSAINRVARGLANAHPDKKTVLVSAMEHHANDLPHRQHDNQVIYIPLTGENTTLGAVDLDAYEALCQQYAGDINYVAISSISNVTGIQNPVTEITRIAHKYGALVLIDGAQSVAHKKTCLSKSNIADEPDFFVFSGHKVYSPVAPGVLVAKKSLLETMTGQDLGGGSVSTVSYYDYELLDAHPFREESGTPNTTGAFALAKVLEMLSSYGFKNITRHANALMDKLYEGLTHIDGITVYGDPDLPRVGALAFNHTNIDHGLFAAILNDYYAIAVRNECFCAHPYVSSMLKQTLWQIDLDNIPEQEQQAFINRKRGMVRASLSLYNELEDVDALLDAIGNISDNIDKYRPKYMVLDDGSYQHADFQLDWRDHIQLAK